MVLKCYFKICYFFQSCIEDQVPSKQTEQNQIYSSPTNSLTHEGTEAHAFQNGKHEFYIYINYMYLEEFLYLSLYVLCSPQLFFLW